MFEVYLQLGLDHILDINGYDHMLFLVALCAIFTWRDWRKLVVLVTAFTIGHCLTLVLSGLKVVSVNADLVEFLIPLSILATSILNFFFIEKIKNIRWHYLLAGSFGLIHGLGFSNYFKALISEEESLISVLIAFNIGVELGQLIIVSAILFFSYVLTEHFHLKSKYYTILLSAFAGVVSVLLLTGIL